MLNMEIVHGSHPDFSGPANFSLLAHLLDAQINTRCIFQCPVSMAVALLAPGELFDPVQTSFIKITTKALDWLLKLLIDQNNY